MARYFITGTNRGIGLHLAKQALLLGHQVIGTTRGTEITIDDVNFSAITLDVTDHDALQQAALRLDDPIDILINNAGIIGPEAHEQTPLSMDFEGFAKTLEINTLSPLAVTQAMLGHLRQSRQGKIINISTQMSSMGYAKPTQIAYRASKVALNKVMQGLATQLAPENIPVCLINPGWVRTDMGGEQAALSPIEVAKGIINISETLTMEDSGKMIRWDGVRQEFWDCH